MLVLFLMAVVLVVWACLRVSSKADAACIEEFDKNNGWGENNDGF